MSFVNYAHRGASEYTPENTLLAFYTGIYMGANGIETDVQRTQDGVLVLFHDDTLNRVTGEDGSIADFTWEQLQAFSVKKGDFAEKIVSLETFLRLFAFRDVTFAIELKKPHLEKDVADSIYKYGIENKTVITSFDYENLLRMHACAPSLRLGFLTGEVSDTLLQKMKEDGISELCPIASLVTPESTRTWHAAGFSVRAWGVKDETLMRSVFDAGADGMTVNFPDKLSAYLKR